MNKKVGYKVELNTPENIRELLQKIYNEADEQMNLAISESAKLANSTKLNEEVMDSKAKYSKAIKDFMDVKQKAIDAKLDIAKLLTEIYKNNGNIKDALSSAKETKSLSQSFFQSIRNEINKTEEVKNNKENYKVPNN